MDLRRLTDAGCRSGRAGRPALTLDGRPALHTLPGGRHLRMSFVARAGDRLTARMIALEAGVDLLLPPGPGGVPLTVMRADSGPDARIAGVVLPANGCHLLVSGCSGGGDRGNVPLSPAPSG